MPIKPTKPCSTPGCTGRAATGRCDACRTRRARAQPSRPAPAARGYDRVWRIRRLTYLLRNPRCALCGRLAEIPDHWPRSRRELVAAGVEDPDADEHLRPLCDPCHRQETARNQPGGWNRTRGER